MSVVSNEHQLFNYIFITNIHAHLVATDCQQFTKKIRINYSSARSPTSATDAIDSEYEKVSVADESIEYCTCTDRQPFNQ